MTTRQDIVDEARAWLHTPWVHQGRVKGLGVDCANFIAAVAEDSGAVREATFEKDYRRSTNGITLLRLLNENMEPLRSLDEARPGDIVAMHLNEERWHVAYITQTVPYVKIIHSSFERKEVVEHRLDAHLRTLIHSVWGIRKSMIADD